MPYWNNTPTYVSSVASYPASFFKISASLGENPPRRTETVCFSFFFSLFLLRPSCRQLHFSPLSWTSTFDPFEEVCPHSFMAAEYMFFWSLNFSSSAIGDQLWVDGFSSLSYESTFVCKKTHLKPATQLDSATWQLQSSSDIHHGLIRVWLLTGFVSFWQSTFSRVRCCAFFHVTAVKR